MASVSPKNNNDSSAKENTASAEAPKKRPINWNTPDNFMKLYGWVEALFFASDRPLTLEDLESILANHAEGLRPEQLEGVIREIVASYSHPTRGFHLVEVAEGWQFRTNTNHVALLRTLFSHNPPRISQAALEAMAIVAYRQPITRVEIDAIRGVDSGGVLRNLMDRRLVRVVGRATTPGRPYLYGTSPEFLEYFGLRSLRELPSFAQLSMPVPDGFIPPHLREDEEEAARAREEAQADEAEANAKDGGKDDDSSKKKKKKRPSARARAQAKAQELFEFMNSGPLGRRASEESEEESEEEQ